MKENKNLHFRGGHFEKIQYGRHQELIAPGTPSKIDHYDLPSPQKKFGAFVRRVNILTLRPLAIPVVMLVLTWFKKCSYLQSLQAKFLYKTYCIKGILHWLTI